jgi:hypothetical protein
MPHTRTGLFECRRRRGRPRGALNESFLIARLSSVHYCIRSGAKCTDAPGNETFQKGETERVVTVDTAYISMHEPLVAARLKQASARLAHLLNGTLGK